MNTNEEQITGYASVDKPWLKYYDGEKISKKLPKMTAYNYLYESNKNHLAGTALQYFNRSITYQELFDNILLAQKAFVEQGVQKGDIVTFCMPQTPENIYMFYALNKIGAKVYMVDPRTSVDGITEYFNNVKSKLVVTIDIASAKIKKAIDNNATNSVEKVLAVSPLESLPYGLQKVNKFKNSITKNGRKILEANKSEKFIEWNDFIELAKNSIKEINDAPYVEGETALLIHTGGTTGTPKDVELSNDNINAVAHEYKISGIDIERGDKFLDIMPPFIAYGMIGGTHMPLSNGVTDILIPAFNPKKFAHLLVKYKPNHFMGVPSHYSYLKKNIPLKIVGLDYIKSFAVGGDTMSVETEKEANEFLKKRGCTRTVAKGLSETEYSSCGIFSVNENNKIGSVGIPTPNTTVKVVDPDTNEELKYGNSGELYWNGPMMMNGYYNNEEENNNIFVKDDQGKTWLKSGDKVRIDEDGFVFYLDRYKRAIVRHDGFKIYPEVIESEISKLPFVEICRAVGVSDDMHTQGSVPVLNVILKKGNTLKDFEVIEQLKKISEAKLPEYYIPHDYKIRETFPLTSIGKVDFKAIQKQCEDEKNNKIYYSDSEKLVTKTKKIKKSK